MRRIPTFHAYFGRLRIVTILQLRVWRFSIELRWWKPGWQDEEDS